MCGEHAGGSSPAELPGTRVEAVGDLGEVLSRVDAEAGALGEVLAQESVGVLVRAALPGPASVGEEDAFAQQVCDLVVAGHLRALVPGQGLADRRRQRPTA